ncbi:MAG: SulP family inorganic anion transporter [Sphaerochaetaceae bacterium]|nr:SulP family inorganic anion transporter [Sphaerochaetaceae bacterium]MDD4218870.1 SulP family inorganic anion transporter [Sphaerochaetaceae bacterium]
MFAQYVQDLRQEFAGYSSKTLKKDLLSGINVAAVALPLSLAFGVASGADAAAGLVTAIFAGLIIGVLGGSSFSISGPTGAMVAILLPLSAKYGVEGVLITGILSGVFLIIASLLKAGKIVSIIPSAVITGFTSGIAVLIAFGQIDNFFGTSSRGSTIIQKISSYSQLGFTIQWQPVFFGLLAMLVMIIWPKNWGKVVPASLAGIILALIVNILGPFSVHEVGKIPRSLILPTRFSFNMLTLEMLKSLVVPAISIAALGMITTLLSGAAGGKLKKERMNADQELFAQGIGNIVFPLFGGVPGCSAVARSIVAIKSGGQTRLVSVFHSVTLIASLFLLGSMISRIPLAALAGVLLVTAWRMNAWESIIDSYRKRYKTSMAQFLVTLLATIIFNLTSAIIIGIALSMILFVIRSAALEITIANIDSRHERGRNLSKEITSVKLVYVTGQLFFGSQDRLVTTIEEIEGATTIILSVRGVPSIDHSAMIALEELHEQLEQKGIKLIFCGLQPQVARQFTRAGFDKVVGIDDIFNNAVEAIDSIDIVE